jgi:molybdopterin-guanine dinucleotide biosynthesis protein A
MTNIDAASPTEYPPTPAVILAGGLARRIGGGDKPMREIGGQTILARVVARLAPQCDELVLNANGQPARFAAFGLPVIEDSVAGFAGPLAGVLAALDWVAEQRSGIQWIVSAPGDCPFLPRDLAARLHRARSEQDAQLAVAASGGRAHPVIGLWNVTLRDELRQALTSEGVRRVDRWTARYRIATVSWPTAPFDPFFNINTADDLAEAGRLVAVDAAADNSAGGTASS